VKLRDVVSVYRTYRIPRDRKKERQRQRDRDRDREGERERERGREREIKEKRERQRKRKIEREAKRKRGKGGGGMREIEENICAVRETGAPLLLAEFAGILQPLCDIVPICSPLRI